ncbi:MAG: hypothetical protein RMK29_21555 [Myxococcales bacterium]|nr:hypothetical protein [Myxococcota bacterium]MDW8284299.1 hypothetical protein [Myxococcales bacterium]
MSSGSNPEPPPPPPLLSSVWAVPTTSPLWMVTQEPELNQLVAYLVRKRTELQERPGVPQTMTFSRARLEQVRAAFARMIRSGEARLHQLSELLCRHFCPQGVERNSLVVGAIEGSGERFTLQQRLSRQDLYAHTDRDLGHRLIERLRFVSDQGYQRATLVANFVEYLPQAENPFGIHRIISRIKAEEELWNKVADEIFDLDDLVRRDKKLCHLSRYVKDVFGIKVVVGDSRAVRRLQAELERLRFSDAQLAEVAAPCDETTRRLAIIEVKNYLGRDQRKQSGWQALKSVVCWGDGAFEVQIQPLVNYHRELERLTRESHTSFKERRDRLRDEVAAQYPLFAFYRDLLRWLFLTPSASPPSFPGVELRLLD